MHRVRTSSTSCRQRRFAPFFWTQALGAGNDNVFKNALVIFVAYHAANLTTIDANTLVNLAAAVFIAPFVLFSATSGQLADKFEKSRLIRYIKVFEIAIMALGLLGFWQRNLDAALRRAGADGRALDAVRPGQVRDPAAAPEVRGTGRRQRPGRDGNVRGHPGRHDRRRPAGGGEPERTGAGGRRGGGRRRRGLARQPRHSGDAGGRAGPRDQLESVHRDLEEPARSRTATASSGCRCSASRGSGSTARRSSRSFRTSPRTCWAATSTSSRSCWPAFSIGIGVGSLLCERLSGHRVELGLVPFGSIGLTLFAVDLWFATHAMHATGLSRRRRVSRASPPTGASRPTWC